MKEKKKDGKQRGNIIVMILAIAAGAIIGIVSFGYTDELAGEVQSPLEAIVLPWAVLLLICVIGFLQLMIHEAGHLIFGLLTGYHFTSFRVFDLMWIKVNGKIRLKRYSLAGTEGQCLMGPPDFVDGKMPFVLYNMGGAILNVLSTLVTLGILAFCKVNRPLYFMLITFMVFGILYAIVNGVPMRLKAINNDGYNAVSLGKNKDALHSLWIQLKMNELMAQGIRLEDMPAEWFVVPSEENMKNSMCAAIGVFTCNRLMSEGKYREADELMEKLLLMDTAIVGVHRSLMINDRIYCELVGENRLEVLNKMLDKQQQKFMKVMRKYPSIIRTEYIYALRAEQNMAKVQSIGKRMEKCAKTYPYPGDMDSEYELIRFGENI